VVQEYSVDSINGESYSWVALGDVKIIGSSNVSKVLVQTNSDGKFELKVKTTNAGGCLRETSQIVSVYGTVSINENYTVQKHYSSNITVYPNPTGESNEFFVRITDNTQEDIHIELVDILGSVLYSNILKTESEYCTIPIDQLSSGMYMLRVHLNNKVYNEKFIIN
jgi:hypothetical protein